MQMSARLRRAVIAGSLTTIFVLSVRANLSAAEKVDFNREVLPILSASCFRCHGPDQSARKAELRLDDHENAVAKKKVIVPGKPDESDADRPHHQRR